MMFKTHIVISLLVALIVFPIFSINKGLFLLVFLIGSFFPDIDSPYSFIGRKTKILGWLFRHRGLFHSIWMLISLSVGIWVLFSNATYSIVFGLGYLVHLITDAVTKEGIYPLYPFRFRIRGFIKTNSVAEKVVFTFCLIAGFVLLLK